MHCCTHTTRVLSEEDGVRLLSVVYYGEEEEKVAPVAPVAPPTSFTVTLVPRAKLEPAHLAQLSDNPLIHFSSIPIVRTKTQLSP